MSEVREQLAKVTSTVWHKTPFDMADAILERFEVTPKPPISDAGLGQYAVTAVGGTYSHRAAGGKLRTYLLEAGLKIVRIEESDHEEHETTGAVRQRTGAGYVRSRGHARHDRLGR